jgi:2-oxoglutarate ferredoxin oxidoreductase subunit alpha
VSYDAVNHQQMVNLRAEKIQRIADDIPPATVKGSGKADLLVVSWGSTYGSVAAAVSGLQEAGNSVDHLHLRYLNPFPANLGTVLKPYKRILVPENNMGQLCTLLRAKYLVDARPLAKVEGRPFRVSELSAQITDFLGASK